MFTNNQGKSREFWLAEIQQILSGPGETLPNFYHKHSSQLLILSAPILTRTIQELLVNSTTAQLKSDQIFTLLQLMESLIMITTTGPSYIENFGLELSETISRLYRNLSAHDRNSLVTNYLSPWTNYFGESKISKIQGRCMEIRKLELCQQRNEKLKRQLQKKRTVEKDQGNQIKEFETKLKQAQHLKTKISQLENQLKRKTEQINKQKPFVEEIAQLNVKVEELSNENKGFNQVIQLKDSQISTKVEKIQELEKLVHNLTVNLVPALEAQLNGEKVEKNSMEMELTELKEKVAEIPELLCKNESKCQEISHQLQEIEKLNEKVTKIPELLCKIESQSRLISSQLQEIKELKEKVAEIPKLVSKNESNSKEISPQLQQIEKLKIETAKVPELLSKIELQSSEISNQLQQITEMESKFNGQVMEIKHLEIELGKYTHEMENNLISKSFQKILTERKAKIETQAKEIIKLEKEKDAELVRHKQKIRKLRGNISKNKIAFENQVSARLAKIIKELQEKDDEIQRLDGVIEQLDIKHSEYQRVKEIANQSQEKDNKLKCLKIKLEQQRKLAFTATEEIEESQRKFEKAQIKLESLKTQNQGLESNTTQLMVKFTKVEAENQEKRILIAECNKIRKGLETTKEELEKQLQFYKTKVENLDRVLKTSATPASIIVSRIKNEMKDVIFNKKIGEKRKAFPMLDPTESSSRSKSAGIKRPRKANPA